MKERSEKEKAFSLNLRRLRKCFCFRFSDLTAACGVTESSMKAYEAAGRGKKGGDAAFRTPYLGTAARLADLYCTSVGRMASYDFSSDVTERVDLLSRFVRRAGDDVALPRLKEALSGMAPGYFATELFVFEAAEKELGSAVKTLCGDGRRFGADVDAGKKAVTRFTANYGSLMRLCRISYREMSEMCSLCPATLMRFREGAEPDVSAVMKLADFFGVSVDDLLSDSPDVSGRPDVIGGALLRALRGEAVSGDADPVPKDVEEKIRRMSERRLEPGAALALVCRLEKNVER